MGRAGVEPVLPAGNVLRLQKICGYLVFAPEFGPGCGLGYSMVKILQQSICAQDGDRAVTPPAGVPVGSVRAVFVEVAAPVPGVPAFGLAGGGLPTDSDEPQTDPRMPSPALSPNERPPQRLPRILIVEDEAMIAIAVQSELEDAGYHIIDVKATGADALDALAGADAAGEMADLVLMDISLRGPMDGIETAARIRALYPSLPVVYLTGQGDPGTRQRAQETRPAAYLVKPCSPALIESTIKTILALRTG